jgi:hypothetical protein
MLNDMKLTALYSIACMAYSTLLREILNEYVTKTDNTLDDHIVTVMDKVFNYNE